MSRYFRCTQEFRIPSYGSGEKKTVRVGDTYELEGEYQSDVSLIKASIIEVHSGITGDSWYECSRERAGLHLSKGSFEHYFEEIEGEFRE